MNEDRIRRIKEQLDCVITEFLKYGGSVAVAYTLIDMLLKALGG